MSKPCPECDGAGGTGIADADGVEFDPCSTCGGTGYAGKSIGRKLQMVLDALNGK